MTTERHRGERPPTKLLSAVRSGDVERVRVLLRAGANPRIGDGEDLPLHVAARDGTLELVELLVRGGALTWQRDASGRSALACAENNDGPDGRAIVALLDRRAIADRAFREAVAAIHAGDGAALAALVERTPDLLHRRNVGPEAYRVAKRHDYFRDPKLFWYVANNPTLVDRLPATIVEVARVMISHGVEPDDLRYTLELLMSGGEIAGDGPARDLMIALLDAGALVTRDTLLVTAGHRQIEPLRILLERGYPANALIAAALGDAGSLQTLLSDAGREEAHDAFGLAIINGWLDAAEVALAHGADVNAALPVHAHGTALHQAAAYDDVAMIAFLLERGADPTARDSLWDGTPLDWARHERRAAACAALAASTRSG